MSYGKGAIDSAYDPRDFWYEPADRGAFDWETGFDIEKKINRKLVVKDQNGSSSCGGQAWSYYGEVLEALATGSYEPRSARWIYSHTHVPNGGSSGKANCDFVIKNGFALEVHAPSYDNNKPPKEEFMVRVPVLSKEAIETAEVSKALSYLKIQPNIELIAQALQDNNGVIISVGGEDNGTWRGKFPKPPTVKEWGHWLFVGGAVKLKGKKYLKVINSWGTDTGEQGWQYIGEDYFAAGMIREGWTLAWDYKPAKHKQLLIDTVKVLTRLVALLKLNQKL